jgi:hypothetical protein
MGGLDGIPLLLDEKTNHGGHAEVPVVFRDALEAFAVHGFKPQFQRLLLRHPFTPIVPTTDVQSSGPTAGLASVSLMVHFTCRAMMNLDLKNFLPNGSGRTISPVLGAGESVAGQLDTFILEAERASTALGGFVLVLELQADDKIPSLALAVRGFARALLSQVALAFDLREAGQLALTDEQAERLGELREELDELIDTLGWTIEAAAPLRTIVQSECA